MKGELKATFVARKTVLVLLVICWWQTASILPTLATGSVSIAISPGPIQLGPNETAAAVIVVSNDTSQPISSVVVTLTQEPGISVQPATEATDRISAGGSASWTVQVTRSGDVALPNGVPVVAAFHEDVPGAAPLSGVATAIMTVQDRTAKAASDILDLHIQTSLTELQGGRAGVLYVVLHNSAATSLQLTAVSIRSPRFLRIEPQDNSCPASASPTARASPSDPDLLLNCTPDTSIAPQQTLVLPFAVRADQAVEPGPHLIVVLANLAWPADTRMHTGSVTTSAQVNTSVWGESQILTLLGIPSLFVLPGFLALSAFYLLWRYGSPKTEIAVLAVTSPQFWVLAITLSLLAVLFIYPVIASGRDITTGAYSLLDIGKIWFASLIVGVLAWVLSRAPDQWKLFWNVPASGDSPDTILEKLKRNDLNLQRPLATVTIDGATEGAFVVYGEDQPDVWVAPPIRLTRNNGMPPAFATRLESALNSNSPGDLATVLKEGRKSGHLNYVWKNGNRKIKAVKKVAATSLQQGGEQSIVEV